MHFYMLSNIYQVLIQKYEKCLSISTIYQQMGLIKTMKQKFVKIKNYRQGTSTNGNLI